MHIHARDRTHAGTVLTWQDCLRRDDFNISHREVGGSGVAVRLALVDLPYEGRGLDAETMDAVAALTRPPE